MTRRINFFEGCSRFKLNTLGLALGMGLKFYIRVAKGLQLNVRKFWGLILTFVENTGKNWYGKCFLAPHPK